jgi:hypothetical protein
VGQRFHRRLHSRGEITAPVVLPACARAGASAVRFFVGVSVDLNLGTEKTQRLRAAEGMACSSAVGCAKLTISPSESCKRIPSVASGPANRSRRAAARSALRRAPSNFFSSTGVFPSPSQRNWRWRNRRGRAAVSLIRRNPLCRVNGGNQIERPLYAIPFTRCKLLSFGAILGGPVAPSPRP